MKTARTKTGAALFAMGTLMLAPLSASALGLSIVNVSSSGGDASRLSNGDILTFDLRLENAGGAALGGLGLGVYGFDVGTDGNLANDHMRFVAGGAVASSVLNSSVDTSVVPTEFNGGLENIRTAPTQIGSGAPLSNPRRVQLFDGILFQATANGSGLLDPAVGGGVTGDSPSNAHFRVSFRATAGLAGPTTLSAVTFIFGVGQFGNVAVDGGGNEVPFDNASYTVTVVPEPGTALLMGLGLIGLAARTRR